MENKNTLLEKKRRFTHFFQSPTTIIVILLSLMVVFFVISEGSAQELGKTVNKGLNYGTLVGWSLIDLRLYIMRIIQVLIGFLGVVAIVLILYGGFVWMTSGGDPNKIDRAKQILINAAVGLFIIIAAFAIVSFVIRALGEAFGPQRGGGAGPGGIPHLPVCVGCSALGGGIIESVYPEPGARDVPRDTSIIITFKELMQTNTLLVDDAIAVGVDGLNVGPDQNKLNDNVEVFYYDPKDPSKQIFLKTVEVEVTETGRIYTFYPVDYLGDGVNHIKYSVRLGKEIKKNRDSGGVPGNDPAFPGAGGHFQWSFTIGTRLDLDPPQVRSIFPIPDNTSDTYTVEAAVAANTIMKVVANPETPRDASVSGVVVPGAQTVTGNVSGVYEGEIDATVCLVAAAGDISVRLENPATGCDGNAGNNLLSGCIIAKPRNAESVVLGCGLTIDFLEAGNPKKPDPGNQFEFTVLRKIIGDSLRVADTTYVFKNGGVIGALDIDIGGALGDFNEIVKRISLKIQATPEAPDVGAGFLGPARVSMVAKVPGKAGNNIRIVSSGSWSAPSGIFNLGIDTLGKDAVTIPRCSLKCTDVTGDGQCTNAGSFEGEACGALGNKCVFGCDEPRNSIIRIDYSEAMLPPTVAGITKTNNAVTQGVGDLVVATDFQHARVQADLDNDGFEANEYVAGTFILSNIYKTVEFQPSLKCGTCSNTGKPCTIDLDCGGGGATCDEIKNSCGEAIYCLPTNAANDTTKYKVTLIASQLETCNPANPNPCRDPAYSRCNNVGGRNICQSTVAPIKNFPKAVKPPDGTADAARNSLDGNRNTNAEGPISEFLENNGDTTKGDTFTWIFWISNSVNLTPPKIVAKFPPINPPASPADNPNAEFDKLLMSATLRPDNHYGDGRCGCNNDGDCRAPDEYCDLTVNPNICRRKDDADNFCTEDLDCIKPALQCYNQQYVTLIENDNPSVLSIGYYIGNIGLDKAPVDGYADKTLVDVLHPTPFPENSNYAVDLGSGIRDIYQNCFLPSAGPDCVGANIPTPAEPYCCNGFRSANPCPPDLEQFDR